VTNALTVDVEDYFHVAALAPSIDRDSWGSRESRVLRNTHKLLAIFEQRDVQATFFVLGWVAEKNPQLVKDIAAHGHEVACHGFSHRLVYEQSPEEFYDETRRAKSLLENITGSAVLGYRAASYSIVRRSLWALDILAEEGFDYDSSIFPIHHHRYGIPDFSRTPVRIELAGGRSIREFPMTTVTAGPIKFPLAGGAYLRFFPPALFRWGFRRLIAAGEPIVLYVHPWEIDPDQPRQDTSLKVRINHYYNLHRTQARLKRLLEAYDFAPLADVLADLDRAGRLPTCSLPSEAAKHSHEELCAA